MTFKIICNKCGAESELSLEETLLTGKRYSKSIISKGDVVLDNVNDGVEIYCKKCDNIIQESYGYTKF